jgi:Uma2 family endonuclease
MATRIAAATKLTYADYCQFPDDGTRHEVMDGEHWMSPPPEMYHQALSRRIQFQLYSQIELTGRGQVIYAPATVQLSEHDIVEPDLIMVLQSRISILGKMKIDGPPNVLIEILSPSTEAVDRGRKLRLYERSGVPEYWIVDPQQRMIEQWVLRERAYELAGRHADRIELQQLAGVAVDLTQVW